MHPYRRNYGFILTVDTQNAQTLKLEQVLDCHIILSEKKEVASVTYHIYKAASRPGRQEHIVG